MTSKDNFSINDDDDFGNTDDLISDHYDPTDIDDDGQEDLPCCWCCRSEFGAFCRFRFFYFFYYVAYQTGIIYVTKELASELSGGDDAYDTWDAIFLAIAAFICFLFSIFLGYLSDINGRRRYIRYTVLVTMIPFLGVLIYPDIWLYFGLLPLFGFVGSTTILSGLFITYVTDIMPQEYLAAGFASIHSIEGSAGLTALALAGLLGLGSVGRNHRIGLGVVFALFILAMLICLCCIKESLPLQRRNVRAANEVSKWACCKIFIQTIKSNKLLFYMLIFYFCILFSFQGIEALVGEKSDLSLLFHSDYSGVLFIVLSAGVFFGKLINPCILCCANCCCKKIFYKIVFFIIVLMMSLTFLIVMAAYKPYVDDWIGGDSSSNSGGGSTNSTNSLYPTYSPSTDYPTWSPSTNGPTFDPVYHSISPTLEPTINPTVPTMEPTDHPITNDVLDSLPTPEPTSEPITEFETTAESDGGGFTMQALYAFIFAFVAGLVFAWSKLLLPLINVLVRGSANKLERGRTFGVLSSIESVCTYGGPLAIINLWETKYPIMAFIVCMILVVIGFIWLFIKLKRIIMMNGRIPEFEVWDVDGRGGRSTSYDANVPTENRGVSDNRHQDLFDL